MNAETIYQCPGETYPISRSVHLGRLAGFYTACHRCPHRGDAERLSGRRAKLLAEVQRGIGDKRPMFHAEGVAGIYLNDVGPPIARRVGQSLGAYLHQSEGDEFHPPAPCPKEETLGPLTAVVGYDGRPQTAELAVAAADGLRRAGCAVVDVGATTAPAVALAGAQLEAAGGLLVGNPHGEPRDVGLTLWGPHATPCSAGSELDAIRGLFDSPAPTVQAASRRFVERGETPRVHGFGTYSQFTIDDTYLAPLRDFYHALRPLRVVIDSASPALRAYLEQLTATVAIELNWGSSTAAETPKLAARVRGARAHVGVWIDGDGECCRLVDECGTPIDARHVFLVVAGELLRQESEATIVVPDDSDWLSDRQTSGRVKVVAAAPTREAIVRAARQHQAALAGDSAGRIWFAGPPFAADALKSLTLLLAILSRSDRPLSEVIASAIL